MKWVLGEVAVLAAVAALIAALFLFLGMPWPGAWGLGLVAAVVSAFQGPHGR